MLADALLQAKDARMQILDVMADAIAEPREEVAATAPRVEIVYIPQDKIGDVIGPRGKIIKELVEVTGAQIDVDEEGGQGVVKIYANEKSVADDAVARINAIANPVLPEAGERFNATVVKTVDFGAFVSLTPGTDGLLHISELRKMVGSASTTPRRPSTSATPCWSRSWRSSTAVASSSSSTSARRPRSRTRATTGWPRRP